MKTSKIQSKYLLAFCGSLLWLLTCNMVWAKSHQASLNLVADSSAVTIDDGVGICGYEKQDARLLGELDKTASKPISDKQQNIIDRGQCLVTAQAALDEWKSGHRLIVDTRSAERWAMRHIPRSINVPAGEVRAMEFLRGKSIALLDEGHNLHAMEILCSELMDFGFSDVKVVVGGLSEWRFAGPVNSHAGSFDDLIVISANDFFSAMNGNAWLIVGIGVDRDSLVAGLGATKVMTYSGISEPIVTAVRSELAHIDSRRGMSVLLIGEAGRHDQARELLDDLRRYARAYVLDGGVEGFRSYLNVRDKMMSRMNQEPKRIKSCGG